MAATAMKTPVDTRRVSGRRPVHYNSLDELLTDAQRLASGPHRTLGNWSLGMILSHLATSATMGLDGARFNAPRPLQMLASLLIKKRTLRGPIKPGFKLPKKARPSFLPEQCSTEEGLKQLTATIERWHREPQRHPHPLFGPITPQEWETIQCRHAELHMSFVVPG